MRDFWRDKKVFLTGNTGFKGSWLSMWLLQMGAQVRGYSLELQTTPSLFQLAGLDNRMETIFGDVRDLIKLRQAMNEFQPEIVIHMAAQPLVRESYLNPVETYSTNVMGTVHVLESTRHCKSVRAVVNVTTDKCYENKEWVWAYRENEPMGGHDPYSNSKGCAELVTSAYRNSFFNPSMYGEHGVAVATARAGNVIGGGDWSKDRLIPDCLSALISEQEIVIRSPNAIRPWQHVLEPLSGYLLLAQELYNNGIQYADAWNFGPEEQDAKPVQWIVEKMCEQWPSSKGYRLDGGVHPHEANYLKLDCSKAKALLNWSPRWNLETAIDKILKWTLAYERGENMKDVCISQIEEYQNQIRREEVLVR